MTGRARPRRGAVSRPCSHGFTLVEILVVAAIVAIGTTAAWLGWLALYTILLGVFLLPWLDRSEEGRRSRWPLAVMALLALGWLALTFSGVVR